tara:strand:- start:130 stop:309 length:180 start_codon:yes stop_codon:yes gene_type:complete
MFTSLAFILALQLEEFYCRLSWFKQGMCIYQCQNGYERFTWVIDETKDGCTLMKRFYKA